MILRQAGVQPQSDAGQTGVDVDGHPCRAIQKLARVEDIVDLLGNFQTSYNSKDFYKVYALKKEVNSLLNEALSLEALNLISDYANTAEGNNTFHRVYAAEDGIVSYYVDGYESVTRQ